MKGYEWVNKKFFQLIFVFPLKGSFPPFRIYLLHFSVIILVECVYSYCGFKKGVFKIFIFGEHYAYNSKFVFMSWYPYLSEQIMTSKCVSRICTTSVYNMLLFNYLFSWVTQKHLCTLIIHQTQSILFFNYHRILFCSKFSKKFTL